MTRQWYGSQGQDGFSFKISVCLEIVKNFQVKTAHCYVADIFKMNRERKSRAVLGHTLQKEAGK